MSIILNRFQPHLHTAPGSIKTEGQMVEGARSQRESNHFRSPTLLLCQGQTQETSHSPKRATHKLKLLSGWLGCGGLRVGEGERGLGRAIVLARLCALDECSLIPTFLRLQHKSGPSVKTNSPVQKGKIANLIPTLSIGIEILSSIRRHARPFTEG